MFPRTTPSFKFSRTALVILIASILLGIILGISTIRNLDREQSLMEDFLKREALTLIHSFEAGARTSRMHCRFGDDPLQTLVKETLLGNNIVYIRIVTANGQVMAEAGELPAAESQSTISKILNTDPDQLTILKRQSHVFAVASEFNPIRPGRRKQKIMQCTTGCCTPVPGKSLKNQRQVIFVALNNAEFIQARQADLKHSLFMGLILFLLGSAGFYFIFLYQEMQLTKTTLAKMELSLERSRRLAALGKMAAGIAHEIRNPLGTLKGFAQYFKDQAANDSESREYADIMIGEVDRLNHIIAALLQFARPREPELQTVSARDIMERAVRLLAADFNKQAITPEITSDDNAEFRADPDLLLQVLINLMKNSLAASGPGDQIILTSTLQDNHIILTITDSGRGMDPEEKERMFDPFFTTRKTGTGLGLAVSYQIIEQHNGRFEVDSRPGQGTRISIILPRNPQNS